MLHRSPAGRRYGYLRDRADHRDLSLRTLRFALPQNLPSSVDLSPYTGPVKDQGDLGACTAFAGTGLREFLLKRYQPHLDFTPLSPLFLYYLERQFDGSLTLGDTGSTGRTSVHCMNTFGVCPESKDPYDPQQFTVAPTPDQITAAEAYKSGAYHRLQTVGDMRSCLASGYAFLVGFTVYASFESTWSTPGYMPVPNFDREYQLGGHEVLFIGYDDDKSAFLVRNSWGPSWGLSGNFYFPYSAAADSRILMDAWIQHLGRPWIN